MALSSMQWEIIRAAYHSGSYVRALARSHGVDESSIRQMARKQGWTRDPAAAERIHHEAQLRTLEGIAGKHFPRRPVPRHSAPRRTSGLAREDLPEEVVEAIDRARTEIGETAADAKAQAIAKANIDHWGADSEASGTLRHPDRLAPRLHASAGGRSRPSAPGRGKGDPAVLAPGEAVYTPSGRSEVMLGDPASDAQGAGNGRARSAGATAGTHQVRQDPGPG